MRPDPILVPWWRRVLLAEWPVVIESPLDVAQANGRLAQVTDARGFGVSRALAGAPLEGYVTPHEVVVWASTPGSITGWMPEFVARFQALPAGCRLQGRLAVSGIARATAPILYFMMAVVMLAGLGPPPAKAAMVLGIATLSWGLSQLACSPWLPLRGELMGAICSAIDGQSVQTSHRTSDHRDSSP